MEFASPTCRAKRLLPLAGYEGDDHAQRPLRDQIFRLLSSERSWSPAVWGGLRHCNQVPLRDGSIRMQNWIEARTEV